jgi:glutathione synthase/RimK-type ligase-like ATP-grasp enzyme
LDEALTFLATATYPLVFKLDIGAAASGVWIAKTRKDALAYVQTVFAKGLIGRRADARARQWRHILIQEFVPDIREWRIIRIGDTYVGHEKVAKGDFNSGSGKVGWLAPPRAALELIHAVTEAGGFRSMDMDVFQTPDGRFLINELQSVFGAFDTAQMYIDGVPGRYRRINGDYVFEEGRFCKNACCNLRIEDLLELLGNSKIREF